MRRLHPVMLGGVLSVLLFIPNFAQAAITVIGPGPATECYRVAENGGDARAALVACDQALASILTPEDRAATFINRGVLELSLNEASAALADDNAGLLINPNLGEGFVNRGAALIILKKYQDAVGDITEGIALGSKRPYIAYYDRAMADEALGDITAAYKDYKQALAIKPGYELAAIELERFKVVVHKAENGT